MAGHAGDPGGGHAQDRRDEKLRRESAAKRKIADIKGADKLKRDTKKSEKYVRKERVAGANVFGRTETTFDSSMKKRADDPRNWEFHYDAKSNPHVGRQDDFNSGADRARAQKTARVNQAKRKAKQVGGDLYDVMKIEFDTGEIRGKTKEAKALSLAGRKRAGTTRVGQGVAAAKQAGQRRAGRAGSRSASAFNAPSKRQTMRIA